MKFLYAKKKMKCSHCKGDIHKGEFYVLNVCRNSATKTYSSYPNHYECFIEYTVNSIRTKAVLYMGKMSKPRKLGRPSIHLHPKKVNRLKSLLCYHKKAGNDDRVKEIEAELQLLTIK